MESAAAYPPPEHVLRDLRLAFEGAGRRGHMPWVPEITARDGEVPRLGPLAILVDAIGGRLAAEAARPDWIATSHMDLLRWDGASTGASVVAEGTLLRSGRTSAVIEVRLGAGAAPFGLATMAFSVLPRRDDTPELPADPPARSDLGDGASGLREPLLGRLGVEVLDDAAGCVQLELGDYVRNSFGALNGGVLVCLMEAAGELAAERATGVPATITRISTSYLSQGRTGPCRTSTRLLGVSAGTVYLQAHLVDAGADDRLMATATISARCGPSGQEGETGHRSEPS